MQFGKGKIAECAMKNLLARKKAEEFWCDMHKKMQNDKITIEVAEGFITIHILGSIAKQIRETLNYNDNISTIEPMKNLDELE